MSIATNSENLHTLNVGGNLYIEDLYFMFSGLRWGLNTSHTNVLTLAILCEFLEGDCINV